MRRIARRRHTIQIAAFVIACCAGRDICAQDARVVPLPQAHAHNDYLHPRPLLDALAHGFCSVEADVFLVDGELLVAHTRLGLDPEKTLRKLYLEPLADRVAKNKGRVYEDGPPFTLLVDIKRDGVEAFQVLNRELAAYPDLFTKVTNDGVHAGAVTVVISGDRAVEAIRKANPRYAFVDGRLGDLDGNEPASLIPLVSDNWHRHFKWLGIGEIPSVEESKLREIVSKAHDQNRRIRFWAIPDTPNMWQVMRDANVDLINTDDLKGMREFLDVPLSQRDQEN